jgi:hypothetical protein
MRRAGVERALISAGARQGDTVVIGGIEFLFRPELDDLPPDERAAILAGEIDEVDADLIAELGLEIDVVEREDLL